MYAFGPIPRQKDSGRVIGTHQHIDRVARRLVNPRMIDTRFRFPKINDILHFEGSRGPDSIKMRSPGRDEPWHFINPDDITSDDTLLQLIDDHIQNLASALAQDNTERAAFEAAWLAHAVVDGLTPAHHEPLKEQLAEIRVSDPENQKFRDRVVMSGGGSKKQFILNNWEYWGTKGVMTMHTLFEAGLATTAKTQRFDDTILTDSHVLELDRRGFRDIYIEMVRKISALDMYANFKANGWTHNLARQASRELLPLVVRAVMLSWLAAYTLAVKSKA